MPYDPSKPISAENHGDGMKMIGDKPYVWQPSDEKQKLFEYLGEGSGYKTLEEAQAADAESGSGSYVEATFKEGMPLWMKAFIATGLASAGITGGMALAGAMGAGGAGAGAGVGAGAGAGAGGSLPAATAGLAGTSLAGPGVSLASSGFAGAGAAGAGAGITGAGTAGTLSKMGPLLKTAGSAIGKSTDAAAYNRGVESDYGLNAYTAGNNAKSQMESQLIARGNLEGQQRKTSLSNMYKASVANNPLKSQWNTRGLQTISPEMIAALNALSAQGGDQLGKAPTYDASKMDPLTYTPPPPPKKKSTLEKVGDWAGPILTAASGYYGGK